MGKKLEASNKAGREFREKCIVVAADTDALRKRIAELEALLAQKEKELAAARKREKDLLEKMATQETVFRIQLQELGQFIKKMKNGSYVQPLQPAKNGKIALDAVDIEAQRQALMHFERKRSQSAASSPKIYGNSRGGNPLMDGIDDDAKMSSVSSSSKPSFDKKTEAVRTKFGNEKIITTWFYTGKDRKIHEVILRHNTRTGKDMKSKRVIVVDGKVRYAEKSKETHFIIKNGKDQLKLNIALSSSSNKGFAYQLFINDVSFTSLHNTYLERIAGQ